MNNWFENITDITKKIEITGFKYSDTSDICEGDVVMFNNLMFQIVWNVFMSTWVIDGDSGQTVLTEKIANNLRTATEKDLIDADWY